MPLSVDHHTSLKQLQTYAEQKFGKNQRIYSKTSTSCWSCETSILLHGSTFRGDAHAFQAAKREVFDILERHLGNAAAQTITGSVFVPNTAMTGNQLKQAADRALVTHQLNALLARINTGASDKSCVASRTSQRNGDFDSFLSTKPFSGIVSSLADLAQSHEPAQTALQIYGVANKLLEIDRAAAKEFLGAVLDNAPLRTALSRSPDAAPDAVAKVLEEVRSGGPSQEPLHFSAGPNKPEGLTVIVGPKLGAGGMGGAVYLATDRATGEKYALKHQPRDSYKVTIDSLQEELHTPASLGSAQVGKDAYLLMKLGTTVDFSKLTVSDFRDVFESLDEAHHFSDNFMVGDLPDYGITHEDIHAGNMMMVDGKLSLIDWGKYGEFTSKTTQRTTPEYSRGFLKEFKELYSDPSLPKDIPDRVDMRAINCATLTRHLILRTTFQAGRDNGFRGLGLQKDPGLFYASVKRALPKVIEKDPVAGSRIALLVKLYEKQMSDILSGNSFTAKDSAAFFNASNGRRGRSNSV